MTEFSSADLDRVLADARETLAAMRADGEMTTEGVGTDAAGQITVTAERGRLRSVVLEPGALELAPAELGERLVTAVNAALDDLRPKAGGAGTPKAAKKKPAKKAAAKSTAAKSAQAKDTAAKDTAAKSTAAGPDSAEQGLQQMEQITQAINDALAKIGGGR
ncbi:hypothetical protein [Spirillospora sp. NPDC029432]|uniref:hypothetical protein n=1 Tax=Spirillospora sp. NPDC029432 TaxID=3154599 RepID=UPI003452F9ED